MMHYVAAATVERSEAFTRDGKPARRQQAICGEHVDYPRQHSMTPTCAACLAYVKIETKAEGEECPF